MFPSDSLVNAPSILDLVKLSEDYYCMNHLLMNNDDDDDDDGMPSKISSTMEPSPSTSHEWLSLMEGKDGPFNVIDETISGVLAAARKAATTSTTTEPDTATSHRFPATAKVPQQRTNKANRPDTAVSKTYSLGPNDVLAGRGSEAWNNQGNKTFRFLVNENVTRYEAAPTIKAKTEVVASIIKYMKEELGTQFVKASKDGSYYKLLNSKETHCKVGHALRDLAKIKARNDTLAPSRSTIPIMTPQPAMMSLPQQLQMQQEKQEHNHHHHHHHHHQQQQQQQQKQERKQSRIRRISEKLLDEESMDRLIQSLKDPPSSSSSAVHDQKAASSSSNEITTTTTSTTTTNKSYGDTHHTNMMDDHDDDDDLEPLPL